MQPPTTGMRSATRPGWMTTEFGVTIFASIVALLMTAGIISQSQATGLTASGPTIVTWIGAALSWVVYIGSRTLLKNKWMQNLASEVGTPPPATLPALPLTVDGPVSPSYGAQAATLPSANGHVTVSTAADVMAL